MSDVSIERCTSASWRRFRDIRLRALAEAPDAFFHTFAEESALIEKEWRERLSDPNRAVLLAVRDGGDIGVVMVGPNTWDEDADPSYYDLGAFWVAPMARRTEISRQLMEAAVAHVREQGAPAVTLWVIGDNEPARRLYESAGFELTGRESDIPPPRSAHEREMILRF